MSGDKSLAAHKSMYFHLLSCELLLKMDAVLALLIKTTHPLDK